MAEKPVENVPAKQEVSVSERFTVAVIKEFGNVAGRVQLNPFQKRLAQHLYIKIDESLKMLENKRSDKNRPPIVWSNVNMEKLALDAMYRIELGLDALLPSHIYPIPYLNSRTKKYDLDLRVGYVGKDYSHRKMAIDPPKDVIYELVHKNDTFEPVKKSIENPVESYRFKISSPFDRGDVIGGFGYIVYEDESKNKLIVVTEADFKKSEAQGNKDFWTKHPNEMRFKTIVNRVTKKIALDPEKVNAAFLAVKESEENADVAIVAAEIEAGANTGDVLEIEQVEETAPDTQPEEKVETEQVDPLDQPDGGRPVGEPGKLGPEF